MVSSFAFERPSHVLCGGREEMGMKWNKSAINKLSSDNMKLYILRLAAYDILSCRSSLYIVLEKGTSEQARERGRGEGKGKHIKREKLNLSNQCTAHDNGGNDFEMSINLCARA